VVCQVNCARQAPHASVASNGCHLRHLDSWHAAKGIPDSRAGADSTFQMWGAFPRLPRSAARAATAAVLSARGAPPPPR
jgi:hypothetical protein